MSNLLKYNRVVVKGDNKLVIDSNKMVQDLLAARTTDNAVNYAKPAKEPDADGFVCGLDAATVEQLISEEPDMEQIEETKAIISDAEMQATAILETARQQADELLMQAREEGHKLGYEEGVKDAQLAIDGRRQELEKEFSDKIAALEDEYQQRYSKMEPELVDVLLEVFSRVTLAIAEDKKDLILLLIDRVLKNSDANKDFSIRVSEEDYKFVSNNKGKIAEAASPDSKIEVSRDGTLTKNQCIIETESGVFDCSLDIQLENLIGEIRLLSCLNSFKKD